MNKNTFSKFYNKHSKTSSISFHRNMAETYLSMMKNRNNIVKSCCIMGEENLIGMMGILCKSLKAHLEIEKSISFTGIKHFSIVFKNLYYLKNIVHHGNELHILWKKIDNL